MSNDGDEYLSDEDMFSPKKATRRQNDSEQPVAVAPGCKEHFIAKYKKLLNGIPPPPDHTNPDFHLDKVLELWRDNQELVWESKNGKGTVENEKMSPLGVCLNVDRSCEDFELMGSQICERFIWSETAATTSTAYVKLTQSAKKRRKTNGWGLSPRTRISYLTRRMTTFQKDNIASAGAANKTTQILIARSEPGKKVSGKGNGLKGKRALFLSPEHNNKFQTPEQGKNRRLIRRLTLNSSPLRAESERLLRNSETRNSSEKKRCSRSLFSTTPEPTGSNQQQPQKQSEPRQQQQQVGGLSTQHRQKMLWAVSNALKAVKIRMTDPEFKPFAGRLFKATTEKWRASSGAATGDRKTSTSDAMLAAAKSLVEEITGRKMSPKSAKKSAPKSHKIRTPEKIDPRDENNPPTADSPHSVLVDASLNENGVFPLERVGILAEKLDPGGNFSSLGSFMTPKKSSGRVHRDDESVDIGSGSEVLSTRKRKRQETERRSPTDTEVMISQRLRARTPRKTPTGSSCGPSGSGLSTLPVGVGRLDDDLEEALPTASPTVKRRKLDSVTPSKSTAIGTPVRQSPRLSNRTPLKLLTTGTTPSKTPKALFTTPSKSSTRGGTPSKFLTTIDETPSKSSPDGTPLKFMNAICRTPLKSPAGRCSPSKPRATVNPLKLLSDCGTPSKSPAVKHARGILTPTSRTHTPIKGNSESAHVPDTTSDGAGFDNLAPKKCVTFENDEEPSPAFLGFSDYEAPPVLRPEALQRRSMRCHSADLPPPKLVREIDLSPPSLLDESCRNRHSPNGSGQTLQTPVSRRRASAPTPGHHPSAGTLETPGGRSGRKKVSLSLAGARKSKTPEDPSGANEHTSDVTLTPRRSSRLVTKSSPD